MRRVRVDKVISDVEWMARVTKQSQWASQRKRLVLKNDTHTHVHRKRNKFMAINHTLHTHQHALSPISFACSSLIPHMCECWYRAVASLGCAVECLLAGMMCSFCCCDFLLMFDKPSSTIECHSTLSSFRHHYSSLTHIFIIHYSFVRSFICFCLDVNAAFWHFFPIARSMYVCVYTLKNVVAISKCGGVLRVFVSRKARYLFTAHLETGDISLWK